MSLTTSAVRKMSLVSASGLRGKHVAIGVAVVESQLRSYQGRGRGSVEWAAIASWWQKSGEACELETQKLHIDGSERDSER
jgi:hypothetical protein